MARSWTLVGFNQVATDILNEKIRVGKKTWTIVYDNPDRECETGGEEEIFEPTYTKEVYETRNPWYESELPLHVYTFSDGRVLESYVQAEPWSSGPNTFLALRDHATKEPVEGTLWPQEEIDSC